MGKAKLGSPSLLGESFTITVNQGGSQASRTFTNYGLGNITIEVERSPLPVNPERIKLKANLGNSGLGVSLPSTSEEYDPSYHDLSYYWEGLPAGTFDRAPKQLGLDDKSISYAPEPVAVFGEGTHNITLVVYNSAGESEVATTSFTVQSRSAYHTTSRQAHVHPSGTTTNAPAGVTTYTTLQAATNAIGSNDGIIWLERGQTYTDRCVFNNSDGSRLFAAVGTGNAPRLNNCDNTQVNYNQGAGIWTNWLWSINGPKKQLVFDGIDFQNNWDPVAETGGPNFMPSIYSTQDAVFVINNCTTHSISGLIFVEGSVGTQSQALHIEDTAIDSFESYPVYVGNRQDGSFSCRNLRVVQNPSAKTFYATSGRQQGAPIRVNRGQVSMEGFQLFAQGGHNSSGGQAQNALKIHENGGNTVLPPDGTKMFIGRGYLESPGSPTLGVRGGANEYNLLVDGCVIVTGYRSTNAITMSGKGSTLRNNLVVNPSAPFYPGVGTAFRRFISFEKNETSFPSEDMTGNINKMYNNTFVNLRPQANNNTESTALVVDLNLKGYQWTFENNVVHQPVLTVPVTTYAPLSSTPTSIVPLCTVGYVHSDGVPVSGYDNDPFGTYQPRTGSTALDSISSGNSSKVDLSGFTRTTPKSLGAWELAVPVNFPDGTDPALLYAAIRNSGNTVGNNVFTVPLPTIDYAGPAGATTDLANSIMMKAGYEGDYLNILTQTNAAQDAATAAVAVRDSLGVSYGFSAVRKRGAVNIAYGRDFPALTTWSMVSGDRTQQYTAIVNGPGTETVTYLSLQTLRPGGLLASIRASGNQSRANLETIQYDTVVAGFSDLVDPGTNAITINQSGWYLVTAAVTIDGATSNLVGVEMHASSAGNFTSAVYQSQNLGELGSHAVGVAYLTAGETITAKVRSSTTVNIPANSSELSVWRLRDADVLAKLSLTGDYNIPNAVTGRQDINLTSVDHGSGALVTANSGKLTIQNNGWYLAVVGMDMSGVAGSSLIGCLLDDGVGTYNRVRGTYEISGGPFARSAFEAFYATAGSVLKLQSYTINGQPTVTLRDTIRTSLTLVALDTIS